MLWIWIGFILFVLLMLALDLGVFHRKAHEVKVKEALIWSAVWVGMALLFSAFIYFGYERHWMGLGTRIDAVDGRINDGSAAFIKYLTGYVIEKSLSVDNIFVIALIFAYLNVPNRYQHRVLFWGILGALLMRGVMIFIGAELIARYHWILYLFGAFLILTGIRMLFIDTGHSDMSRNPVLRLLRRWFPITEQFHGQHFWVRAGSERAHKPSEPGAEAVPDPVVERAEKAGKGAILLTPLAPALVLVEATDLLFAVDSIPAIFAITADPFLVFTSNVFAILGLRSLYFALAGMMDKFRYLKVSLAAVLTLVGVKMLAANWLKSWMGPSFNFWVLGLVALILATGVIASVVANRRSPEPVVAGR